MKHQRSADRDSLLLLAVMRLADQAEQRIKVRNLSNTGLMAETSVRASGGDQLTVELRNIGWVSGTVAWVADNRFGMIFDREIDCKVVRRPVSADDLTPGTAVPRPRVVVKTPAPIEPGNLRRV